jgi:hypothetical protein
MALRNQRQQAVCLSEFCPKVIAIRIGVAADERSYEPGIKAVVDRAIGDVRYARQNVAIDQDAGLLRAEIVQTRTVDRPTDPCSCW